MKICACALQLKKNLTVYQTALRQHRYRNFNMTANLELRMTTTSEKSESESGINLEKV